MAEVSNDQLIANPTGPVVLVGAGSTEDSDWTVDAFVSGDQICISSRFPPFGEGGVAAIGPRLASSDRSAWARRASRLR